MATAERGFRSLLVIHRVAAGRVLILVVLSACLVVLSQCLSAIGLPRTFAAEKSDLEDGAALFRSECAGCHGLNGTGGRGPDLTRSTFLDARDDAGLFRVIATGIPGSPMSGVGTIHSAPAMWQLVVYVRSLSRVPPVVENGNAAAGQQLFEGRGQCLTCHNVDGPGVPKGPDLTDIGRRRAPAALRRALVKSSDEADPAWWWLRVIDAKGTVHVGRRMDEDTFSVRLLRDDGTLCAFDRAAVQSIERITTSPMPNYGAALTLTEIDDLVAYLRTLARR